MFFLILGLDILHCKLSVSKMSFLKQLLLMTDQHCIFVNLYILHNPTSRFCTEAKHCVNYTHFYGK